ncbi:MAG: tetratricopeptide repeat protein, partial [Phycisphaerae bacterium]
MTRQEPDTWMRLQAVFEAARRRPPQDRDAFLTDACAGDTALQRQVERLLAAADRAETFLETPVAPIAAETGSDAYAAAAVGRRIGRYDITRVIASGGMGTVYEATQAHPQRTVALKVLKQTLDSPSMRRRFEFEVEVLGQLQHPGIAQIFDAGTTADTGDERLGHTPQPFFAMELVDGAPLTDYADARGLDTNARLRLIAKVCDAVHHAHQKGVIHRDLKPANILVDDAGQPKILDFGIARATGADIQATTHHTDVGQIIGTLPYMSPEQVAGDPAELDLRSDVYALGVVTYEMLAGRLPYDLGRKTVPEAVRIITEASPPPLSTIHRAMRGDVATITAKALEKHKDRRYQSASDLAADIRRYLADEPITARPASRIYHLRKFARRNRMLVGASCLVLLALAGGAFTTIAQLRRAVAAERTARDEAGTAKAVTSFLQETLGAADPGREHGPDYTVRQALADAARRVEGMYDDRPAVEAGVRNTIGSTYVALGMLDDAEPHLRAALRIRRAMHHGDHPDVVESLNNLGALLHAQAHYADAERSIRDALAMQHRLQDADDAVTADIARHLGLCLKDMARYEAAARWLEHALVFNRTRGGARGPLIQTLNDLAHLNMLTGDLATSERLLREGLALAREHYGPESLFTARMMSNLGTLCSRNGRMNEAEPLIRRALDIRRDKLGDDHPDVASTMIGLAAVLKGNGAYADAAATYRAILESDRNRFPDDHPYIAGDMSNLAAMLERLGDAAGAEPLHRTALAIYERRAGPDHPDTLVMTGRLALCLKRLGRYQAAERLYLEALDAQRRVHGPEHPETLWTMGNLARLRHAQGRLADAEPLARETLERRRRTAGDDHPATLVAANNLGLVLIDTGALDEAASLLGDTLERRRRVLGDTHPDTLSSMNNLGHLLCATGRARDAEPLLRETLALRRDVLGEPHAAT